MRTLITLLTAITCAVPVFAQRADDNPLTSADDAFGTSVGIESIGLYTETNVRGFSALAAGNARIDGLYLDRQAELTEHLADTTSIRVGSSAQGYPLPAPTGIVDYKLRRPGDSPLISVVLGYGGYDGRMISADAQLPIVTKKLSIGAGATLADHEWGNGGGESVESAAVIGVWRPSEALTLVPFWSHQRKDSFGSDPVIYSGGPYLPPEFLRGQFYGQDWANTQSVDATLGLLTEAVLGSWAMKGGVFHSSRDTSQSFADLFEDTRPDGLAHHWIIADPPQSFASTSGELRVARVFLRGSTRQTMQLAVRSRDQQRRYGGSDLLDLGLAQIGVPAPVDKPDLTFSPQTHDSVTQTTLGAAYQVRWPGKSELSFGLQKARYRKTVRQPEPLETVAGTDAPWLGNVGSTVYLSDTLAFYASYSRGLEEGGVAPVNALNKDAAPPAIRTAQWDAGVRYELTPNLRLVAGVFDISKPYYNLDAERVFRRIGSERHRGVEISISGEIAGRLSLAFGTVLLDPVVEAEDADAGLTGRKPAGQISRTTVLNAEYHVKSIQGLSFDTDISSFGSRVGSVDNRVEIPARRVVGIGARQRFTLGKTRAALRVHVGNVFDNFGWISDASGMLVPNDQRSFLVNLYADF